MKRKILAVLLMLVLGMTCAACDMDEAVESGGSNAAVSMEGEAEEKEATSTPVPVTEVPTNTPTPTMIPSPTELPTPTVAPTSTPMPTIAPTPTEQPVVDVMVWLPATGEKYHNKNNCGRMNPDKARQVTKSEAERLGYESCSKCY